MDRVRAVEPLRPQALVGADLLGHSSASTKELSLPDLILVLLTVGLFVVLAVVVRGVERL